MIHIRIDNEVDNAHREFACGVDPLPGSDLYVFEAEYELHHMVTCPGCGGHAPRPLGTPIRELSGQPGKLRYEEFKRIARSWGYE